MIRDKLDRFSSQITGSNRNMNISKIPHRYRIAADTLGGELLSAPGGAFLKITASFPETHSQGFKSIGRFDPKLLRFEHFANGIESGSLPSEKLLFFDMETTGLGGSGTVPFLIGFGSVTPDGFQVRQYFLPDYPDEAGMLEAIRGEIALDSIIVSYNGKAFDLPILIDRLILHRIERNLEFGAHIDLLHPVRRLYKRRLKDCSLSNIEREILGYFRHDDIPGYLVPSVYFNWLATENACDLKKVVRHNADDIVSLFFIIHHIAEVRHNPAAAGLELDDLLSLARILEKRGEHLELGNLLTGFGDIIRTNNRHDLLFLQSLSYKRAGIFAKALLLWEEISKGHSPESFYAKIELAKFYEHRARDIRSALNLAYKARIECRGSYHLASELERRISRLEKKSPS